MFSEFKKFVMRGNVLDLAVGIIIGAAFGKIVALVLFLVVRWINRLQSPPTKEQDKPSTKDCPYCKLTIPIEASRCPECTSHLDGTEEQQHQKAQVDVRVHTV